MFAKQAEDEVDLSFSVDVEVHEGALLDGVLANGLGLKARAM